MFGDAIDYAPVKVTRRKFFPLQPKGVTMAPMGSLHFHPAAPHYCDDFAEASLGKRGHFIHEMTHVWQAQQLGRWYLVLRRHPWCRYDYAIKPGWTLEQYGIEQQAEIVRHAFLLRQGAKVLGVAGVAAYEGLVDFHSSSRAG